MNWTEVIKLLHGSELEEAILQNEIAFTRASGYLKTQPGVSETKGPQNLRTQSAQVVSW